MAFLRELGDTGLTVSALGLGTVKIGRDQGVKYPTPFSIPDDDAVRDLLARARELGINLIDTAPAYGRSEERLGQLLRDRQDWVIVSKVGEEFSDGDSHFDFSPAHTRASVERSLRRLNTDYIDLYQYHFPDPLTPIDETLGALDDLVRSGKVRHIACSNLPGWQLVDAAWTARHHGYERFLSTQAEYSLLARSAERELFPALRASHMTLLPYFPLASGLLTGKYRKGGDVPADSRMAIGRFAQQMTEARIERVEALIAFAAARGRSVLELAMSWLAGQPIVSSIIAGATRPEQVRANVAAAGWTLSADDLAELDRLTLGGS